MNDEFDVEETLKRYNAGPGEHTKRSVMDKFRRTHDARAGKQSGLWRRPVPLYRAAIAILLLAGVSFAAGREFSSVLGPSDSGPRQAPASQAAAANEIDWVAADRDFL